MSESNTSITQLFWLLRCTENQYAKSFIDSGCIKLNTPKKWIEMERLEGKGRGDSLEGTYSCIKNYDFENYKKCIQIRKNVSPIILNNDVYFRSDDAIKLPSYCLFGLSDKSFTRKYYKQTDVWANTKEVGKEYFHDFYGYSKREEINNLPEAQRPVLLVITSPKKFFQRLRNHLEAYGIKNEEVLIENVIYLNKSEPYIIEQFPKELFIKDQLFKHQSEVRIVINTHNRKALKQLNKQNLIIHLGDLSDITMLHEYYLEDMFIEHRGNELRYALPVPKTTNMNNLSRAALLAELTRIQNAQYIEDYEKSHIAEQVKIFLDYYEKRFNERVILSKEFYKKIEVPSKHL